jgi:hypothetical protein
MRHDSLSKLSECRDFLKSTWKRYSYGFIITPSRERCLMMRKVYKGPRALRRVNPLGALYGAYASH